MCGWQYKQRWIDAFPWGRDKERLRGRQRVWEKRWREKTERWRWQRDIGSVTVSCRLVSSFLPSALGRSLAHNMESINPHRIPLSPPDTCPVCLPLFLSLSVCLFVCLLLMYIQDHENLVSRRLSSPQGYFMKKDSSLKSRYYPLWTHNTHVLYEPVNALSLTWLEGFGIYHPYIEEEKNPFKVIQRCRTNEAWHKGISRAAKRQFIWSGCTVGRSGRRGGELLCEVAWEEPPGDQRGQD